LQRVAQGKLRSGGRGKSVVGVENKNHRGEVKHRLEAVQ
jgi:hypothetical protein